MLWTICVILLVLWAAGMATSYTAGELIHILVIALVIMVIRLIQAATFLARSRSIRVLRQPEGAKDASGPNRIRPGLPTLHWAPAGETSGDACTCMTAALEARFLEDWR
jgi:hypothetical protein